MIGWVNFLDDSSQKPHMKLTAIEKAFGVAQSTGQGKLKEIRDLLKTHTFDTQWTLPSRMDMSPMAWMIEIGRSEMLSASGRSPTDATSGRGGWRFET